MSKLPRRSPSVHAKAETVAVVAAGGFADALLAALAADPEYDFDPDGPFVVEPLAPDREGPEGFDRQWYNGWTLGYVWEDADPADDLTDFERDSFAAGWESGRRSAELELDNLRGRDGHDHDDGSDEVCVRWSPAEIERCYGSRAFPGGPLD